MKWPARWDDVSAREIKGVMPLVWQLRYSGDDYEMVMAVGAKILAVFGHKNLSDAEVIAGVDRLKWMIGSNVTKRPFEFIWIKGRRYYLPLENHADTDGIEIAMANMYYLQFTAAASENSQDAYRFLWVLLAMICRPRVSFIWNAVPFIRNARERSVLGRVAFDNVRAEGMADCFEKLPLGVTLPILNYWEEQNRLFMEAYKGVFDGGDSDKSLFQNGEGWLAVLEDVAKDGVHGEFKEVCATNAHTIWTYLSHQKIIVDAQK